MKLFFSSSYADEVSWEMYLKGGCCTATESQLQAAYASQSPSFQVRVSGVVQIHEESEQGNAKSKAG